MALSAAEKLARRIEKAEGPSRELDAEICRLLAYALGARRSDHWYELYGEFLSDDTAPRLTESVDASMKLLAQILPGWFGDVDVGASIAENGKVGARLFPAAEKNYRNFPGEARTSALALAAAMVRSWSYKDDTEIRT